MKSMYMAAYAAALLGAATFVAAEARAADDTAAVTAANDAFYEAETARDPSAMERLWAHEDYVAFVGPRTKEPIVGWNALQPYWARSLGNFAQFSLKPVDTHIRVSGIPLG